jgi:hypothetical protein
MRALLPFLVASLLTGPALAGTTPPPTTVTVAGKQPATPGLEAKAPERAMFDRMIGSWDVTYEIYDKDGKVRRLPGQVTYGWILDGKALQEIWSDLDGKQVKPYATTIGYSDAKHGRWTAAWIYPAAGMPTIVSGGVENGRLVLTGHDQDGALQRWSIDGVQADAFVARYESSEDEGKTWRLVGVNHMRRHVISSE